MKKGNVMTRKTVFFSFFCILFLFSGIVGAQPVFLPQVMSSTNSLVGTWNLINCTGSCGGIPNQLVFNADGTGTFFEGTKVYIITWTLSGNQLTVYPAGGETGVVNINWIDNNNFISTDSDQNATWKRA